jgi:hypothetical protein
MENIALIVGAGSVENSWNPILAALQPFYNGKFKLDRNGANALLANVVYFQRCLFKSKNWKSNNLDSFYNSIKIRICEELVKSQNAGEIRAWDTLSTILEKYFGQDMNRLLLITTNWDEVIEIAINSHKFKNGLPFESKIDGIHIHGKVDDPHGIYLPSEITREPYRIGEDALKHDTLHAHSAGLLEKCNRAIIYGLSLDPLDAELASVLTIGLISKELKEIIIIDKYPMIVAQRIKVHYLGKDLPKICCYLPTNLDQEITV